MIKFRLSIIKFCVILFFLFTGEKSFAQQPYHSTHFILDKYDVNPAYAGMDDVLNINARYRQQWQGIDGNPEFIRLNAHLPLYNINGGAGFKFGRQKIGLEKDNYFTFSYNHVFPLSFGLISVAAKAGLTQKSIDAAALRTASGIYNSGGQIDHKDQLLSEGELKGIGQNYGMGIYFFSNYFDLGMVFDDYPVIGYSLDEMSIQKCSSMTIHWNYFLNLPDPFKMDIFTLLRTDFIQWQSEAGVGLNYGDKLYTMLQFRGYSKNSLDALSIGIGGRLNRNIFLAYNYDLTLSSLRRASNGSHEILIRYFVDLQLGKKLPESIIHSPRLYD